MKIFKLTFLVSLTLFISLQAPGQELDSSIIQDLSSDQLAIAQEALNNEMEVPVIEESSESSDKPQETLKDNEDKEKSTVKSNKFGYDFISTSPTSIVATGDLPLPNDYKISLGDVIGVVLSGSKEKIFDMRVQLDGTVFFLELGSISVVGESFRDVKNKFSNLVEQSYIGVSIDLSLKNLSAKKITIVGAVNNPGTYLVNPFTTISNSLAYSGGIQEIGSLRNIRLIRSNGETFKFDLYDLLIDGSRKNDITIESGDVIIVDAATKFINITGMVNRPGTYEITSDESLLDLVKFAMGFTGGANIEKITLDKLDANSSSIIKIITKDVNHSLDNVLSVNIFPILNDKNASVLVSGAITEPGFYSLEEFKSLEMLINELDFIDVYPWLAILEQFDENNLIKSSVLFNLNDPSTYKSIELMPNSKVYFTNINDMSFDVSEMTKRMIEEYELRINYKQESFRLPIYGKFSVSSFVDLLGLDMTDVDSLVSYVSPLEDIVINDDYKKMRFTAKKFNTVTFRAPSNNLIEVSISGAVEFPGIYVLTNDSTVQDLFQLVGAFKNQAYLDGIALTREVIRERQLKSIRASQENLNKALLTNSLKGDSVGDINLIRALSEKIDPENLGRLAGDFSPGSDASLRTTLFDGDKIVVPKNPNAINVLGEVLNPIAFEYTKKITVKSAIDQAGGFQQYADKRRVYVIKANGIIQRPSRNVFRGSLDLEPGDTIVVPRKIITDNPGIQALVPITQILSDIAFSAAALDSLSNN